VAPAIQGARGDAQRWISVEGTRLTAGRKGRRVRQVFVVAELTLAVMLLAGAGLMVQSFVRLRRVDAGFDTSHMLTMRLSLPREKYKREQIAPFFEDLSTKLAEVGGVRVAAAATQFPPGTMFSSRIGLENERSAGDEAIRMADVSVVTTGFFTTMGYRLNTGRVLSTQDVEQSPRVVVINETAAKRFFPNTSALGRRLRFGDETSKEWVEVVGVVADVRNHGLDAPTSPEVFVPVRQAGTGWNNQLFLVIRTAGDPLATLPAVRAAIASVDPDQPAYLIASLDDAFAASMAQRRIAMLLLTIFAGVALMLAAIGVYGIMSYMVSERTHEIGIRVALGAPRGQIVGMVIRQTAALVTLGIALGLAGALALGRAVSGLVFGVRASDPPTLAIVALVLGVAALLASYLPARRAATVSPLQAMRG
jgi:putative ABC transport system permease protein